MTNEQLVIRIQAGENVAENMEQLYLQVKGFIHTIAWKYQSYEDIQDLEQEGYLALYPAIDGYDPSRGVKFLTYAEYHIRQHIQRYIQMNGSCLRLPVHCREKMQRYKRFYNLFMAEYGRKPTDYESAGYLGLTLEQVRGLKEKACMVNLKSLDAPVKGMDGGDDTTVGDLVPDSASLEDDILDRVYLEQRAAELWACVNDLDGPQPDMIRKRYQGDMTLKAISQDYGTTLEMVRQTERKALRKLRGTKYSKRLLPFIDDIRSRAMIGVGSRRFNETWESVTERVALRELEREERQRDYMKVLESVAISQQII